MFVIPHVCSFVTNVEQVTDVAHLVDVFDNNSVISGQSRGIGRLVRYYIKKKTKN